MSILSSLWKKRKPNLAADITHMSATQSPLWGNLKQFSDDRLSGKTAGFGEDFTSLANPAIQASERGFKERTMPRISSELSSRGLARSAGPNLATDVITRANQEQQSTVDQMLAQFDYLNRIQSKQDITEGVNVGKGLQTDYLNQENLKASASERLANATAGQQNKFQDQDRQMAGQVLTAGAQLFAPALGQAFKPVQQGPQGVSDILQKYNISPLRQRTLDSMNEGDLDGLNVSQLLKLFSSGGF